MPRIDGWTLGARAAALVNYTRQLAVADRLADEAQLAGVPAGRVWFCASDMTLTQITLLLDRARAAELLDPRP